MLFYFIKIYKTCPYLSFLGELGYEDWPPVTGVSRSLLSRLAARGLEIIGAQESSELKELPLPSLNSKLTSRFPLATLASFRSIEPECECPMLKSEGVITHN